MKGHVATDEFQMKHRSERLLKSIAARFHFIRVSSVFHLWLTLFFVAAPRAVFAQPAAPKDEPLSQLGGALKPILASSVPATLFERTDNWDHQAMVPVGIKWRGLKATTIKSLRNHGEWKKLILTSQNLPRTLDLQIYEVKNIDLETQTFKVFLTFQMGVYYDQQNWANGIRLWSGSLRARAQVTALMDCENTLKADTSKGAVLPDFIFRLRVTTAKVSYEKLVVEHVNGIGGDAARLIGGAVHEVLKQWRPSIERDLLNKASAAIVKTADTREIRIAFGSLLKAK